MSSDKIAAVAVDSEGQAQKKKSATLKLLPNSETFHVVKDVPVEKAEPEVEASDEDKQKSSTFKLLPNSKTLHPVK